MQILMRCDTPRNMGFIDDIRNGILRAANTHSKSVTDLARLAGVEQGSLSRFLRGKGGINLSTLAKIADEIGVRVVFPGEEEVVYRGCQNPELEAVDRAVSMMRSNPKEFSERMIKSAALIALEEEFESKTGPAHGKQTKLAS